MQCCGGSGLVHETKCHTVDPNWRLGFIQAIKFNTSTTIDYIHTSCWHKSVKCYTLIMIMVQVSLKTKFQIKTHFYCTLGHNSAIIID